MWKSGVFRLDVPQVLEFIKSPAPEVVAVINKIFHVDIYQHEYRQPIDIGNNPLFLVYQFKGCEWTTIEFLGGPFFNIRPYLKSLVGQVNTEGISFDCNDTTVSAGYQWFNAEEILDEFFYPNPLMNEKLSKANEIEAENMILEAEDTVDNFLKSKNISAFYGSWSDRPFPIRSTKYQVDFFDNEGESGNFLTANDFDYIYLIELVAVP